MKPWVYLIALLLLPGCATAPAPVHPAFTAAELQAITPPMAAEALVAEAVATNGCVETRNPKTGKTTWFCYHPVTNLTFAFTAPDCAASRVIGFQVESKPSLNAPWTILKDIGTNTTFSDTPTTPQKFYRVAWRNTIPGK